MHVAIRWVTAPGKISTLLLLAVVPIAIAIPADLVLSQSSTGNTAQIPLFSAIDLNPPGFTFSYALGISHGEQVGFGEGPATGGIRHALLWLDSAESVVDLNPPGFTTSQAFGTCSGQEVGDGWGPAIRGFQHALLWRGSAASVVDLHPAGYTSSYATGVSGGQQVGDAEGPATGGHYHALLWRGSASSVLDLHAYLPPGFAESRAEGIDSSGAIVGEATPQGSQSPHAFLWVPIKKGARVRNTSKTLGVYPVGPAELILTDPQLGRTGYFVR